MRRSAGRWERLATVARGRERWNHDERVLGSSDFVAAVIEQTEPLRPKVRADDGMPSLLRTVAARCGVTPEEISSRSLRPRVLAARAIVCQLAVGRRGWSLRAVGLALGISKQSVTRAVGRAAALKLDWDELDPDR